MAYAAKLVNGETYDVMNVRFVKGEEVPVDKNLYEYLKENGQFEVKEKKAPAKAKAKQGDE